MSIYSVACLCSYLYRIHVLYLEIQLEFAEKLEGSQAHVLHSHQMLFFPICLRRVSRHQDKHNDYSSMSYCDPLEIYLSEVIHNSLTNHKVVVCKIL